MKHNLSGADREKIEQPVDMEAEIAMYQRWIDNEEWPREALRMFAAEVDGKVLGYILLGTDTPKYFAVTNLKQMYLADIAVHRSYGGQGLGGAMIEWMKIEAAKSTVSYQFHIVAAHRTIRVTFIRCWKCSEKYFGRSNSHLFFMLDSISVIIMSD